MKIIQTQNDKYYIISLIYGIKKKIQLTEAETGMVVAREPGEWEDVGQLVIL